MVPGSARATGMRHAVAGGGSRLAEGHPRGLALTRRSTPPTLPQGLLDGHFRPASLRAKGGSLLRCILIRGRGVTSVRASARTNFYPCRLCSPGTQCGMRTKCAGKPRLPARSLVAGLADALLDLAVAAGVGRGRQSQAAGQFTPVGKAPPAEQLLDQHPGALRSDGAQSGQLRHLRLLAVGELLAPRGLQRLDLLLDQRQACALALDLGAQCRRYLLGMAIPPTPPVAPADD